MLSKLLSIFHSKPDSVPSDKQLQIVNAYIIVHLMNPIINSLSNDVTIRNAEKLPDLKKFSRRYDTAPELRQFARTITYDLVVQNIHKMTFADVTSARSDLQDDRHYFEMIETDLATDGAYEERSRKRVEVVFGPDDSWISFRPWEVSWSIRVGSDENGSK